MIKSIIKKIIPKAMLDFGKNVKSFFCHFSVREICNYIKFYTKKEPTSGENVFFDILSMDGYERSPSQIIKQFMYCGYNCYVKFSLIYYLEMYELGKIITSFDNVYFLKGKKKFSVVVSGNEEFLAKQENCTKILFRIRVFTYLDKTNETDIFCPCLLHPKRYNPITEKTILSDAFANITSERKIAALFCGNVNNVLSGNYPQNSLYNRDDTKKLFNTYTRMETFLYIYNELPDLVYIPESGDALVEKMNAGELKNKIVLIDSKQTWMPYIQYMEIIRESDFFIYMPGWLQPFCHNHIESMISGCIPITQFNRFYLNIFNHQQDALLFEQLDELKQILQDICSGKYHSQMPEMRQKLLTLYNLNFSFDAFRINLLNIIRNNTIQYNTILL
jgi:muconolactone delta-isomerase